MKTPLKQLRQIIREEIGKTGLTEAKRIRLIVTNEKTDEKSDVAMFYSQGDAMIALTALQKSAPSHMKYSIKK